MAAVELNAEIRTLHGKGPSRRVRKNGKLPAIVYSKGDAATSVVVEPKDFVKVLMGPLRRNVLIALNTAGKTRNVMVRDVQINPVRREATHVDFWEVDTTQPVVVPVPFKQFGRSKAVVAGAKLSVVMRTIRVRVLPGSIPEKIDFDVTDLPQGALRAKEVVLPAGCELVDDGNLTVLTVSRPRGEVAPEA